MRACPRIYFISFHFSLFLGAAEVVQALAAEMARCRNAADTAAIRAGRAEAATADAAGRLRDAEDMARRHAALQVRDVGVVLHPRL